MLFEMDTNKKIQDIKEIKKVSKCKIGVGDNDLHYMSDSDCCCGIDTMGPEFENWLKYNMTYIELDVINKLDNTATGYTTVRAQQMPQKLHSMADDILHRTSFITIDKTATSNAHQRVLQKKAPAGKKEEFKDCTIWEVMLSCYRQLNTLDVNIPKVFYTVNCTFFAKLKIRYLNHSYMIY